ncbi:MAG: right-handed parallel beta-helix repeat-containing protein [Candidatus Cloacimonetes bacterium]|nr:right-handed parallel beta-helix repeat-containing protein [Candidatus Cloacimonadota bacterium]
MSFIAKSILIALVFFLLNLVNEINLVFANDIIWSKVDSPIIITEKLHILSNTKLIISHGVTILFEKNSSLEIYGSLIAIGKKDSLILFQTKNDHETWSGLHFYEGNNSAFEYVHISDVSNGKYDANGAISLKNYQNFNIKNSTFTDNFSDFGGAINISNSSITIENTNFRKNTARLKGAAIYIENDSKFQILNCEFFHNNSDYFGGAIYFWNQNFGEIIGSVFAKNNTLNGGAFAFSDSEINMINNTITQNSANYGGGIWLSSNSKVTVTNSIIWNNIAALGNQIYRNDDKSTINFFYCNLENGSDDLIDANQNHLIVNRSINQFDNPIFMDVKTDIYHLQSSSSCINSGSPETEKLTLPEFDIAGNIRIIEKRIDIGAYERKKYDSKNNIIIQYKLFYLNYSSDFDIKKEIEYNVNESTDIKIMIFNKDGDILQNIYFNDVESGSHTYKWDGYNLNNEVNNEGYYFYRVITLDREQ